MSVEDEESNSSAETKEPERFGGNESGVGVLCWESLQVKVEWKCRMTEEQTRSRQHAYSR
jgi:hypothetical protein